ncbi:2-oxoglutarate dehydrogenase complex dihydrolipoyllysine-residue succinyltransferase [Gallionella capsiferriformans]|uniref:Dihydrolipoyllysine-residue succinyltransferase component of 2-oxoglutarate dehydrogenase complex n=1 Tax=Gallionella capsiferriformans (strain ES-2) TaxID=395494 RepID=D9SFR7_GALCS|nr:2-oxoglutarate dehydrogenase complex dihydrolipoyllysine-residue succinyltransferase [Gallionella capsiferriformans]ADL55364.1 2-oxoglutarate dehydrogenase, E2 subunit, dihydrolipoamide succinyltransferase [Gallionella capsiferriformans ES-2]
MSIIEVKVPQLSESVSEATLLTWHKKVGDAVLEGENLIDVETDKVVMELPASKSGVLKKIIKADGDKVGSEELIALIDTTAVATAAPAAAKIDAPVPPSVRKLAHELDIDAASLEGSGRAGRVTKEDVLSAATPKAAPILPSAAAPAGGRPEQRVPMTRIRQRIAERLVQSQQTAAILTTFNEVNMQPVIDLRTKYKDAFEKKHGVKLGFSSFFAKAAVYALQKFPIVNASVDGTDIIYHGYFDIGIAIGSERGLTVPILRDVDKLSFADIEKQIVDFGARAKTGKLTMEELTGGTFSISNGGTFGSMLSTPIINPPQAAILGIHATKDRAVVENGQIVIRPINYLAVSYDHRIIDGREAVQFLVAIKEALESPERMLLDL